MKISRSDAALLTARERAMLQSTGPWHVRDLVSLIKRLRGLRDKQRQLAQRQAIASARDAKGKRAAGNARTMKKGAVLDRALKHYEAELAKLDQQSSAATRALKVSTKPPAKAAAGKATGKKAAASRSVAKKTAAKKPAAKKAAAKKPVTKKPAAKKAATKKPATKKPAAKKAVAKKAVAGKTAAKQAAAKKAPAKPSPAQAAIPTAAMPPATAMAAAGHTGPERSISAKARIRLPKGEHGHAPSQVTSLPSLHRRGLRGR